jgi:hypothetical protein
MKPFKKAFVFVLVLFCFVSFADAQVVITAGTFSYSSALSPGTSSLGWTIGGENFYTTGGDFNMTVPLVVKRAGAPVEEFTVTLIPQNNSKGNATIGTAGWINFFYGNINHPQRTTFKFTYSAHALPKFTPDQRDIYIQQVPFTMNGVVSLFGYYDMPVEPEFTRTVTGSGTAQLFYQRLPQTTMVRRKAPNPEVRLGLASFTFAAPTPSGF